MQQPILLYLVFAFVELYGKSEAIKLFFKPRQGGTSLLMPALGEAERERSQVRSHQGTQPV